jgi:hypothetical protein
MAPDAVSASMAACITNLKAAPSSAGGKNWILIDICTENGSNQGLNLVLTALFVPSSLGGSTNMAHAADGA